MSNNCFLSFKTNVTGYSIPKKFPSPFLKPPNPLCRIAVTELQAYLKKPIDWTYDFGLNQPEGSLRIGKMFGVLVVQNQAKELGYLAAFSGKLANKNHHKKFVPPVFDSLTKNSFLNIGMVELNKINHQIKLLEASPKWLAANQLFKQKKRQAEKEIQELQLELKEKKSNRALQRLVAKKESSFEASHRLNLQLNKKSTQDRKKLKQLKRHWTLQLAQCKDNPKEMGQEIQILKALRKKKSNSLQQQLFDAYQFLNHTGASKSLTDIFQATKRVSGAGECAAPKLLQYAFLHHFKPIALAEFWWGKSPKSKIRKHGHFYPPCEEKCRPILGYMLENLGRRT